MKNAFRKFLCVIMSVILLAAPISSNLCAAAETAFSYPQGVSAERANNIVSSTDTLLLKATQTMSGKTLAENVMPMLYEGDLLGSLTVGIYSALSSEDMAEMLSALSIQVTPADLSAVLFAYPDVSKVLSAASSWDTVDLSGVSWNVHTKAEFASAFGVILSPLNTMLQFLLCEGSFNIIGSIVKANGGNGYENAVVPLYQAFGCTEYLSYSDYKAQATANAQAVGANLILPLLTYIEKMLDFPLTELCGMLPNLAYFILNDGFEKTISALMQPITELASKIEKIPLLNSIISDSAIGSLGTDFAGNFIPDMNTMLSNSEMNITLPEIDWELLASCGTVSGNTVTADKGKTFVVIFRWLWEVLQSNSNGLSEMLLAGTADSSSAFADMDISSVFDELLKDDADKVIKALAFMLDPSTEPSDLYWVFGNITTSAYSFTDNMPRENYAKMTDGFDNLLGSLIAEMMGSTTPEDTVKSTLYTNDNITALTKMLYSALSSKELSAVASLLGIDTSVKSVLSCLTEEKYKATVSFLNRYIYWDELPDNGLSWGFTNGDREGFIAACAAVLRPLQNLISFLLAGEDFVLLDSVTIRGGNGYNSAVIPLFEALGMAPETYVSFAEYKNGIGTDALLTSVLSPLFMQIEKICASPVTYLTEQLPTVCYFISDGGLQKMLYALATPLLIFIEGSGLSIDVMSVIEEITQFDLTFGEEQVNKLIAELQNGENGSGIALPEIPALTKLASLGTLKEVESKRTFEGKTTTYKMVEADKESVMAYLVDFMVSLMQMPENSDMMSSFTGGGADTGTENPFAAYTDSFAAEMEGMSHDEMVKWFYDMLVIETGNEADNDQTPTEIPHIIYEPEDDSANVGAIFIVIILLIAAAVITVLLIRKKKNKKPQTKKEETEG